MWIHESFTTYAENLLVECTYGYDMSIRYLNLNKSLIKNETPIVGPLGVNYEGWEDSDMYYKGAWILHTFRNVLKNDSLWFSILKGLQQDLALQTVTTTDVIQYINKSSHQDFTWFFDQYLYSAKPPILEFYLEKHKKKFYLSYRWNNTREDFKMDIPLQFKPSERIYISPTNTFKTLDCLKKDSLNLCCYWILIIIYCRRLKNNSFIKNNISINQKCYFLFLFFREDTILKLTLWNLEVEFRFDVSSIPSKGLTDSSFINWLVAIKKRSSMSASEKSIKCASIVEVFGC